MSIASELNNLEGNIEDSYDAVNDMGGIVPAQRNMDNLDQAIRTIPQNQGTTYTAGTGIDITNDVISVDNTTVPFFTDLATVATTGDYGDLLNTPTIPAAQVNSDWNANSGVAQILNKPSLATVATSGLYSDLTGTPSLATVATSGDYDDLLNKPTIPTVNDATLTIQHNGTTVQTFSANSSTNKTANIETIWADDIAPATQVPPIRSSMIDWSTMTSSSVSSADFVTAETGYTISVVGMKKMGNILIGSLVIKKDSGYFGIGQVVVGVIKSGYRPNMVINSFAGLGDSEWSIETACYFYVNAGGSIYINNQTGVQNCNYVKASVIWFTA